MCVYVCVVVGLHVLEVLKGKGELEDVGVGEGSSLLDGCGLGGHGQETSDGGSNVLHVD